MGKKVIAAKIVFCYCVNHKRILIIFNTVTKLIFLLIEFLEIP